MANHESLIVLPKASEQCPLNCAYCYEGDKSRSIMTSQVLESMINKLETRPTATHTTYIWHGREPLTAGKAFYEHARQLQKPYEKDHKITNGMQTNGVLLTPELADFFVKEGFDLGFSVDGPPDIHDTTRPYRGGRPSYEHTLRAINLMRERGKTPGVIAVLTKKALPHLERIMDFFKKENLSFKLNPIMRCGNAEENSDLMLTDDEVIYAVTRAFDRWFDASETQGERYSNGRDIIQAMFAQSGSVCHMMGSCQTKFLSIGTDGTAYPCSRFSDDRISYGNILKDDITTILEHPLRKELQRRADNPRCKSCDYVRICNAGCMHHAYLEGDINSPDPNCKTTKKIYDHIATRLVAQLEEDGAIRRKKHGNKLQAPV